MNKCLLFIALLSASFTCVGQNIDSVSTIESSDSLLLNKVSFDIDFMFYITRRQFDEHSDLKFVNGLKMNYLIKTTEFSLFTRQLLDRTPEGSLYSNHYVNLSYALNKYKPAPQKGPALRFLRPEFVFIFQNNSGRGLQKRFQTGLFFYPLRHLNAQFKLNIGLGVLYDWSSWEVNNVNKIYARSIELQEKVLFVNSHSKLRNNIYFDFSEWRPTLYISLFYQLNDIFCILGMTSYQQSLVSPFNDQVKAAYPELSKVYPYFYSHWEATAKIFKGFAVKSSFTIDYENNNISIYDSSWEYNILFGFTWNFSKKTSLSVDGL